MPSLEEELKQIGTLGQHSKDTQTEANERMSKLRKRIKAGESTGDRVRDWAIVRFGSFAQEAVQFYQELEARLAAHVDQFILIVLEEKELLIQHIIAPIGGYRDDDYSTVKKYYLAVIGGTQLVLDLEKGTCGFPTERYAELSSSYGDPDRITEGALVPRSRLGLDVLPRGSWTGSVSFLDHLTTSIPQVEIVIGDADVERWFSKHGRRDECLCATAKLLGRPMEETEEYKTRQQKLREQTLKELKGFISDALATKGPQIRAALKAAEAFGASEEELTPIRELLEKAGMKLS